MGQTGSKIKTKGRDWMFGADARDTGVGLWSLLAQFPPPNWTPTSWKRFVAQIQAIV